MGNVTERLMRLPIFHGVGREDIFSFLEKIPVDFVRYAPGEVIARPEDTVECVMCVIGGCVSLTRMLGSCGDNGGHITLRSEWNDVGVLGLDHLFGMSRCFEMEIRAVDNVSIIKFERDDYLSLIAGNRIYALNLLNYLSHRSQRSSEHFSGYPDVSPATMLARMVDIHTEKNSNRIEVKFQKSDMSRFLNMTVPQLEARLESEIGEHPGGECKIHSDGDEMRVDITDRAKFLASFV